MRYIEVPIYKFVELNHDVKEEVLNRFRETNDMPFLDDSLMERLKELLIEHNIEVLSNLKIHYSLTHSQGDGFCFTGDFLYQGHKKVIEHHGHYYNAESVSFISSCYEEDDKDNSSSSDPYDEFIDIYTEICHKIEKIGYEFIYEENSEEHIRETIECNEYEFFSNGDIVSFRNIGARVLSNVETFDRIFDKARSWLNNGEFDSLLCRCYGAMSVQNGRYVLVKTIEGQIYDLIANRKRK